MNTEITEMTFYENDGSVHIFRSDGSIEITGRKSSFKNDPRYSSPPSVTLSDDSLTVVWYGNGHYKIKTGWIL